jgi:hypothetical protein
MLPKGAIALTVVCSLGRSEQKKNDGQRALDRCDHPSLQNEEGGSHFEGQMLLDGRVDPQDSMG